MTVYFFSVIPEATHEAWLRALEAPAQKALQGFETERKEFLRGTNEENNKFSDEGPSRQTNDFLHHAN